MTYKDMTFCTVKDCTKLDCHRNTNGYNFTPDEFWKDKVAFCDFKDNCPEYKRQKEQGK